MNQVMGSVQASINPVSQQLLQLQSLAALTQLAGGGASLLQNLGLGGLSGLAGAGGLSSGLGGGALGGGALGGGALGGGALGGGGFGGAGLGGMFV